jgi:hypothetical protein
VLHKLTLLRLGVARLTPFDGRLISRPADLDINLAYLLGNPLQFKAELFPGGVVLPKLSDFSLDLFGPSAEFLAALDELPAFAGRPLAFTATVKLFLDCPELWVRFTFVGGKRMPFI